MNGLGMQLGFCIAALGFGLLSSGGVLTVLLSVGLLPRFMQRTNTAKQTLRYETMVILGTILGGLYGLFPGEWSLPRGLSLLNLGEWSLWRSLSFLFLCIYGLFAGMFEGCLALAIAELLDTFPIAARRLKGTKGKPLRLMRYVITSLALGKLFGSILYFYYQLYHYGGE